MPILNGYIVICLSLSLLYMVGFLTFLTDHEENKCEMTYMFQYPQFVQIVTPHDYKFGKYGLYAYNEGHFTEKTRDMYFDGIPVLFIPGNAGSYKQVRSFASIALRKALNSQHGFYFDYFTVDLNEEFSGLNGALLAEQSDYVNKSIHHIFTLYKNKRDPPTSIILIGHSMGGVIAQHISSQDNGLIPLIITLSSPIFRPSLMFDHYMHEFYKNINYKPKNTLSVHISGGLNDFLVPAYLAKGAGLNVVSTHVPKVWVSADHLCILWCKQLVLAVNRALFDSVDHRTKQIIDDKTHLSHVFHNHLVKNSGVKINQDIYENVVSLNNAGEWIEKLPRQYTVRMLEGTKVQQWHMIPYVSQAKHEFLSIVAINLEVSEWIFACSASSVKGQSRVCVRAKHLSHYSEIAPTANFKRRNLHINMHELKQRFPNWTHIVAKVPPTKEPVILHVDVHNKQDRTLNVNLPKVWSFTRQNIVRESADKAIFYELKLPSLNHLIQSYFLYVEPFNCQHKTHHASASLTTPWTNENLHKHFTETDATPFHLRLYSSNLNRSASASTIGKLTLDPGCKYRISIRTNWFGNLSQFARYYSPLLFANVVAVVLMTLRSQFKTLDADQKCPLFFVAMKEGAKPYYVLTATKLISKLLGVKNFSKYLPISDWTILSDEGSDFFLLPLLLYITSVGIVWILTIALSVMMVVCEATANKLVIKFVSMTVTGVTTWSEWVLKGFQKLPGIVAVVLIIISITTCGGLALSIGTIFYFFKLTKMSQDFIEGLMWKIFKKFAGRIGRLFTRKKRQESAQQNTLSVTNSGDGNEKSEKENERNHDIELSSLTNTKEAVNKQQSDNGEDVEDIEDSQSSSTELTQNSQDSAKVDDPQPSSSDIKTATKSNEDIEEISNVSSAVAETISNESTDATNQNDESSIRYWMELLENDEIFFHFTMFLLWSLVTFINVPVVLIWAHNYKYSKVLQQDPSFVSGTIFSTCALVLWQFELPKTGRLWYQQLGNLVFVVALATLIYCPISIYRLNYLLSILMAIIVLHQVFAPNKINARNRDVDNNDDTNISSIFERIKAKLE